MGWLLIETEDYLLKTKDTNAIIMTIVKTIIIMVMAMGIDEILILIKSVNTYFSHKFFKTVIATSNCENDFISPFSDSKMIVAIISNYITK